MLCELCCVVFCRSGELTSSGNVFSHIDPTVAPETVVDVPQTRAPPPPNPARGPEPPLPTVYTGKSAVCQPICIFP